MEAEHGGTGVAQKRTSHTLLGESVDCAEQKGREESIRREHVVNNRLPLDSSTLRA